MLKLLIFSVFLYYAVNLCSAAPSIAFLANSNALTGTLDEEKLKSDGSNEYTADDVVEFFDSLRDTKFEDLPMILVVLISEKAKEENKSFEDILMYTQVVLDMYKNKKKTQPAGTVKLSMKSICPVNVDEIKAITRDTWNQANAAKRARIIEISRRAAQAKTYSELLPAMNDFCAL